MRDGNYKSVIGCGAVLALGLFMSYIFHILGLTGNRRASSVTFPSGASVREARS